MFQHESSPLPQGSPAIPEQSSEQRSEESRVLHTRSHFDPAAEGKPLTAVTRNPDGTVHIDSSRMEVIGSNCTPLYDTLFACAMAVWREKGTNYTVPYNGSDRQSLPSVDHLTRIEEYEQEERVVIYPRALPAREGAFAAYVGDRLLKIAGVPAVPLAGRAGDAIHALGVDWERYPGPETVWYSTMTVAELAAAVAELEGKLFPQCEELCRTALHAAPDQQLKLAQAAEELVQLTHQVVMYASSHDLPSALPRLEVLMGVLWPCLGRTNDHLHRVYGLFIKQSFPDGSWESYQAAVENKRAELARESEA